MLRLKWNSFNEHKNVEDHMFWSKKIHEENFFLYIAQACHTLNYIL